MNSEKNKSRETDKGVASVIFASDWSTAKSVIKNWFHRGLYRKFRVYLYASSIFLSLHYVLFLSYSNWIKSYQITQLGFKIFAFVLSWAKKILWSDKAAQLIWSNDYTRILWNIFLTCRIRNREMWFLGINKVTFEWRTFEFSTRILKMYEIKKFNYFFLILYKVKNSKLYHVFVGKENF